jgi:hypothetical protein
MYILFKLSFNKCEQGAKVKDAAYGKEQSYVDYGPHNHSGSE